MSISTLWHRISIGITVLSFSLTQFAYADPLAISREKRQVIRNQITTCQTFLVGNDQNGDDSVGIPFSSNNAMEFENQLKLSIAQYGKERFRNGTFYVLGVTMDQQSSVLADFSSVLERNGLREVNAQTKVLSVPTRLVRERAIGLARHVLQRLRYFFPSLTRDYQTPQTSEVVAGMMSSAVIEIPNVIFLYGTLPLLDANLTVITHAVVLGAYSVYAKAMLNWLLRSGSKSTTVNNVELFVKQMLLSVPFVLNYNVFGQFSEIASFYSAHGWEATLGAFPEQALSFASTQGLTLVLQTIFYSQVITSGFGAWVDRQQGVSNSAAARALRPILQTPVLMADSVVLAMTSNDSATKLLTVGPMEVNTGHVGLAMMALTGILLFKKFPQILDPLLRFGRQK